MERSALRSTVLLVTLLMLTIQLCCSSAQDQQLIGSTADESTSISRADQHTENNIAFDLPDLTATLDSPDGGEFQIEAYKSTGNDVILQLTSSASTGQSPRTSQLFWVSVGQPAFVETTIQAKNVNLTSNNQPKRLFHFTTSGFYTYIQMLTPTHRGLLAAAAKAKYGVPVDDRQIVNLVLSRFDCQLFIHDEADNKYLISGRVTDFRNYPLRMDFRAPRTSMERKLFAEYLQAAEQGHLTEDMHFTCHIASRGKLLKTNTLTISLQQVEQIGLVDKLFGPATSDDRQTVYVTRQQLTELAAEMYSTLNIVEEYEMPQVQFSDAFVEGLILQAAVSHFTMVSVENALGSLSDYGFDFDEDLQPDTVQRDLGSILRVNKHANKTRIVVDEFQLNQLDESSSVSASGKVGLFGIGGSVHWARNNAKKTSDETKSLSDQLHELNVVSHNDIRWAVEGNRVIPKSLIVARLSRSKTARLLKFQRVRLQQFSAAFDRTFGLYTSRAAVVLVAPALKSLEVSLKSNMESLKTSLMKSLEVSLKTNMESFRTSLETKVESLEKSLETKAESLERSLETKVESLEKSLTTKVESLNTSLKTELGQLSLCLSEASTKLSHKANTSVFSVARTTSYATSAAQLPFDVVLVDTENGFDSSKTYYTVKQAGYYMFHFSAGVPAHQRLNMTLRNASSTPNIILTHTKFDGAVVTSRDDIQYVNEGQRLYISSDYPLMSDSTMQTSWSGLRLDGLFSPLILFRAARTRTVTFPKDFGNVSFDEMLINVGGGWDARNSRFVAPRDGIYFFSWSSASVTNTALGILLYLNNIAITELPISSGRYDGSDTATHSVLIQLRAGDIVTLRALIHLLYSDVNYQTSFLGFLYEPIADNKAAWSLGFNGQANGPTTIPFNSHLLLEGVAWDSSTRQLTIVTTGTYYLKLSGVAYPREYKFRMDLVVNSQPQPLMSVMDSVTSPIRTEWYTERTRALITSLQQGDILEIRVPVGYEAGHDDNNVLFAGFRVY